MLKNLEDCLQFLTTFKHHPNNLHGKGGVYRIEKILNLLGNPQETYPIIHIAGTSGKTSTTIFTASILTNMGLKTAFTVSPHLISFLERFQINNQNLSNTIFLSYFNEIVDILDKHRNTEFGYLTYFDVVTILALYIFYKEKVDVAVLEVGCGGLYDATNIRLNRKKITVINKIGYDHQAILGQSLSEIAYQKAGIIQPYNDLVFLKQSSKINTIIKSVAKENLANTTILDKTNISKITNQIFDFKTDELRIKNIQLQAKGDFQFFNSSLAILTAFNFLKNTDNYLNFQFNFDQQKFVSVVKKTLKQTQITGRFEIVKLKNNLLILDGAHNSQKMETFIKSLIQYYPNYKFDFLVAIKENKDLVKMFKNITKIANKIYLTKILVDANYNLQTTNFENLINSLKEINYHSFFKIKNIINFLNKYDLENKNKILIATGSLYLVAKIKEIINN